MAQIPSPFVPSGAPVGSAGGDLSGTYPNPTVVSATGDLAVGNNLTVDMGSLTLTNGAAVNFGNPATTGSDLYLSGTNQLTTDYSLTVAKDLSVTGVGHDVYAVKAVTTSRANTTTPTDDPELTVTVVANAVYMVFMVIGYTPTSSGAGIKYGWTFPSGATMQWTDNDGAGQAISGTNILVADDGTGPMGLLQVGSTGGAFTMRWSQNTTNATATNLLAGSCLYLRRLA